MTSLALNLSIFFVVLASICFSAPIVDHTTMESELFDTTEVVRRAFDATNEHISHSSTTEKGEEEMTTISTETSSKSSHDKESEGEESRETREFSEMNTSESPLDVTKSSTSYPGHDSHYDRTSTTVQPRRETETQRVPAARSDYETKKTDEQMPRESSTTVRMMSTSTSSSSSSKAPEKYVGRFEDQREPSEDVETTTKFSRSTTKKPKKNYEKEEQQRPTKATAGEVSTTEENDTKENAPVAQYDPKAMDSLSGLDTKSMQYDENNQSVSYAPPELTTMKSSNEKHKPKVPQSVPKDKNLNQA